MTEQPKPTTYIDAFVDFSFKRLFATEESKPILIGFLNHIFKGRKYIVAIEYGKNEFHGEIAEEGGAIFDITCTEVDGSKFIIEIQRGYQKHFKDRALYYTSRAISEQAPKGSIKEWGYNLTAVYLIAFLEDFTLPGSPRSEYLQDICLANRHTGLIFYEKLNFIFIEMLNFVKGPDALHSELDKWLYALKHLTEFEKRPEYLSGPEFDQLFNLAKYANLTRKERDMYNASLKYKWDNKNVRDYAAEQGREEGLKQGLEQGLEQGIEIGEAKGKHKKALETAAVLKGRQISVDLIIEATGLTIEEIERL